MRQYELVETVKAYDPNADEGLLNRAYVFAMQAHGTQTRASGDPYFNHPLEVAGILTKMKLDDDTIATALLHDVVEDTVATQEQIEEVFGPKIGELVDGVTKLSKLKYKAESTRQAENFRKFLLAISNDIRVLLVKLADRLHNMRTLDFIKKPEKRQRIARETIEIYAPLAERLGMHEIKDELEELSFKHLDPEAMETITSRLSYLIENSPTLERDMIETLKALMVENDIGAQITGRIKKPYSIWRKMETKSVTFERLTDVMAFRVIVDDIATCYRVLGIVHQTYQTIPGKFKDYISIPKRNNYRSIHTSVIGPHKRRLEIQIRTPDMHEEAELGVAAHWQYKQRGERHDGAQFKWVRELLEILEHGASPEEFLEHTKLAMYQDKVFCFTPKGDLVPLPRGSSPVDFAYAVHTEVGDHCTGALVNGRMVPLRHVLQNGDQVEIMTDPDAKPSPRWESFVVTGKASSAIRRAVRDTRNADYRELGQTILEKSLTRAGVDTGDRTLMKAVKAMDLDEIDDLYTELGKGTLSDEDVLQVLSPDRGSPEHTKTLPHVNSNWSDTEGEPIPILGLGENRIVELARCCLPLRGDRIVGIRETDGTISVHTIDCASLDQYDSIPDKWLDLTWQAGDHGGAYYTGRLILDVINERGALASIAALVAKRGGNISNVDIVERDPDFYVMLVDVEVRDNRHLLELARTLKVSRVVSSAERYHMANTPRLKLAGE